MRHCPTRRPSEWHPHLFCVVEIFCDGLQASWTHWHLYQLSGLSLCLSQRLHRHGYQHCSVALQQGIVRFKGDRLGRLYRKSDNHITRLLWEIFLLRFSYIISLNDSEVYQSYCCIHLFLFLFLQCLLGLCQDRACGDHLFVGAGLSPSPFKSVSKS